MLFMNVFRLLLIVLLLSVPVFADYKMDIELKGECPPDNTVEISCTDIGSQTTGLTLLGYGHVRAE